MSDDPQLRARLHDADPARGLQPLDPAHARELARLAAAQSRPSRLPLLVAAAATLVAGTVGVLALAGSDEPSATLARDPSAATAAPTAGPDPGPAAGSGSPSPEPSVTQPPAPAPAGEPATVLSAAAPTSARCSVPSAEVLAGQDTALTGTVLALDPGTGADGATATLRTDRVWAGAVAAEVVVQVPTADLTALLGAVQLDVGGTYLLSSTEGQLSLCGLSGPATPELTALYEQAWGG